MTLSIRYFVEAGNTSPHTLLITISRKPIASILRRGRIISRMSGHNSRRRSDERFLGAGFVGAFCGTTAVYTIVWDAPGASADAGFQCQIFTQEPPGSPTPLGSPSF